MKPFLAVLFICLAACFCSAQYVATVPATHVSGAAGLFPGWTYLQDINGTEGPTENPCVAGNSTCTLNTFPTTAGSAMAIFLYTGNTNVTISSASGGGGTWTKCPASACHDYDSTAGYDQDIIYNTTGTGSATSVSVTLSGASTGLFYLEFVELAPPSGYTPAYDTAGTANVDTDCTACTAVGLTLSGTDAVIQFNQMAYEYYPPTWNPWSSPYYITNTGVAGLGVPGAAGLGLNLTSGVAPTYAQESPGTPAMFSAIAFKTTSAFTASSANSFFSLVSVAPYVNGNPASIDCAPNCSFTIPSTTSGHLGFLEAFSITGAYISSVSGAGTSVVPSACKIALTYNTSFVQSCAYMLSLSSAATSLSITMSASAEISFAWYEVSRTSGSFVLDTDGSQNDSASCATSGACPGMALTLSGTNDVIFQGLVTPPQSNTVTLYSAPYWYSGWGPAYGGSGAMSAVLLNTVNGSAPSWNVSSSTAYGATAVGVAFK